MDELKNRMEELYAEVISQYKSEAVICAAVGGVTIVLILCKVKSNRRNAQRNQQKMMEQRAKYKEAFETLRSRLNKNAIDSSGLVELQLEDLIEKLQVGQVTPTEVLHAYQSKALQVTGTLNCVQTPILEAGVWAKQLEKTQEKGPLHGVPVSIKDHIPIQGYDCTIGGCSMTFGKPFREDSVLVKVLKRQGAVPFVTTTVPQALLAPSCTSPLYGTTLNPVDVSKICGGSSGGEGALIGGGGSILGFGTDMGGSIRCPAAFCGICGLKPTVRRLSTKGLTEGSYGQTACEMCVGPLARDVESLVVAMKALLVPSMWELDPYVAPIPFREEIFHDTRPLRIGYLLDDNIFTPIPACRRAVTEAAAALARRGHTLIPYEFPDKETVTYIRDQTFFADGGKLYLRYITDDKAVRGMEMIKTLCSLPWPVRWVLVKFFKLFLNSADLKNSNPDCLLGLASVDEWWKLVERTQLYRHNVLNDWKEKGLDAVICPVVPSVALPHEYAGKVGIQLGYTMLYNILDFPAGVLPVTKVTQEDQRKMADYPTPGYLANNVQKAMETGTVGLPVAVQCSALPFHEELLLRVMQDLQDSVL